MMNIRILGHPKQSEAIRYKRHSWSKTLSFVANNVLLTSLDPLGAELNSWMKSIRSLHQSTLKLKLHIIQFGKLLAHHVAACFPASRQTSESILLARAVATRLWSTEAWAEFCAVQCEASLPLHNSRKKEAEEVKAWRDSQPSSHRVLKTVRKRTVHTVPRRRSFKSKRDVQRAW